ncbi:glycosyltransferase family 4 protein [Patescibacteria group bacterium]|nr:glycosyltransferase family 4 protein [Patescibacteria group bacterium]
MRIGIDCRLAGRQHAGIGRYTAELVKHLVAISQNSPNKTQVTFVLFVTNKAQAQELLLNPPNFVEWVIAPVRHYSCKEQLIMPWIFAGQKLDLLHVPHFNLPLLYRGKVILTIHDLLWHYQRGGKATTLPAWQYNLKYGFYRLTVAHAISKALAIIVPSQKVRAEVQNFYPQTSAKIHVLSEGVSIQPPKSKQASVNLPKDYLLYVGSLYPHKNIPLILKTLQLNPQLQLVIVTARSNFALDIQNQISLLKIKSRVWFLFNQTDEDLAMIYTKATALIQPSFSEGFGLTGLEAMACGTPVLASNIAVFREIYGEAALYFDPHHPKSLLDAIGRLPQHHQSLIKKGAQQIKRYSWVQMATEIFKLYQSLVQS